MISDIRTFTKTYFAIGAAISILAIYQTQQQTEALSKIRSRYKWVILMAVFAVYVAIGLFIALRREPGESVMARLQARLPDAAWSKLLGIVLILAAFPVLWLARADFYGSGLQAFFRLMWLFWALALVQTLGWRLTAGFSWPVSFAFAVLLDGMVAQVYAAFLPVTDYPFSAGWSEASRFYYASLPFSRSVYGEQLPLSVWHGTRYFLQSIPFAIKGLPLWFHRLWQVILWVGMSGLSSWALVRRLRLRDWTTAVILGAWFFLYLFQGAVYYHLQVCVIIILLGMSPSHPVRTLIAVAAASLWAGMSRLNWYPVPAMLAITLYLLEEPLEQGKSLAHYLTKPALWGAVGLSVALLGQWLYIVVSGNTDLAAFSSSLRSALLFYRWLPSPTNPIGIIPGIVIVSLPLWLLLFLMIRGRERSLHPLRWMGLLALTTVLLAGGLVVSTKIGGGGDLHNMDAYIVLLGIVGAYFIAGRVQGEGVSSFAAPQWPGIALMLVVPVAFTLLRVSPPFHYDHSRAAAEIATLRSTVENYSKSGPVLFINERQLLTFGTISNVRVVPEDEVVSLMEMAISGNKAYLTKFYQDLASHRFAAIVAHKQNLGVEGGDFIEENNAWTSYVAQPLLCQYRPIVSLDYSDVEVFVPRQKSCPTFPPALDPESP